MSGTLVIGHPGELPAIMLRAGDRAGLAQAVRTIARDRAALGALRRGWPQLVPSHAATVQQHADLGRELARLLAARRLEAAYVIDSGQEIAAADLHRATSRVVHLAGPHGTLLIGPRGAFPPALLGQADRARSVAVLRGLAATPNGLAPLYREWRKLFPRATGTPSPGTVLNATIRAIERGGLAAPLLTGAAGRASAAQRADAPKPVAQWDRADKVGEAITRSRRYLTGELREMIDQLLEPANLAIMVGMMLALAALQLYPPAAAAVDTALVLLALAIAGIQGVRGLSLMVETTVEVMFADTEAEIDAAAKAYAKAFVMMGTALLSALLARGQMRAAKNGVPAKRTGPAPKSHHLETTSPTPTQKTTPASKTQAADDGPNIALGSKEAAAAKRVYAESHNSAEPLVIGKLDDTAAGAQLGMRRLNDPDWTPNVNDAWIQGGIDANKPFYLGSNPTIANLRSSNPIYPESVFMRELKQLRAAGYTRQGDWMVPPGR